MLTNATAKSARAAARPYKMADAGGLYLYVRPSGRKTWRVKFRYLRREKLLTIGDFPDIGLGDAREQRDQAREQLRKGEDPSGATARARATSSAAENRYDTHSFEAIARRWHAHSVPRWSTVHAADVLASLERDIFPVLGAMPIDGITTPVVLSALRVIEARGRIETARRVRQRISGVFGFAISEGLATADPAAIVARALAPPPLARRQPALLELSDARALLAAAELVGGALVIKLASRFLALTAVRLATLRGAIWDEFESVDWKGETTGREIWRVPAARMKLTRAKKADPAAAHLVPLSAQAVEVLRAARATGGEYALSGCNYAFPGRGERGPIGEAAIGDLYRRAGYGARHVPHGWRATFSTILNERYPEDRALIDRALAHAPKDRVEAAYNRAEQLDRRRDLLDRWAQLLADG